MGFELKNGQRIRCDSGEVIRVIEKLGEGHDQVRVFVLSQTGAHTEITGTTLFGKASRNPFLAIPPERG